MREWRMILMVYYRRNLLVLSFTTFLAACSWNQVAPFLPLFIKELGVKGGVAFWAGVTLAAQTVATIVMMPYWGKLADKYGPKLMVIRAGICVVLIYLGMSYCRTLWQLVLLRVLNGVLTGFIPSSITLVAINTPKPEAARYVAIIQSVVAFGAIAGPALGSILAEWVGYRGSMLVSCIVVAVAVLLVWLLVEERQKATGYVQPTSLWQDFRMAFQKPVLVTALCSDMTYGFLTMASQPLLILYIQELTGSRANLFTGPIFALPGLAVVLTNYCWCRLGERRTFQRIILVGLNGAGIFTLLQGLVGNIFWFAITYFLAGLFAAAVSPSTAGLVATKVEADFQGRAFAIQQSSRGFGCFLAPLLAGLLGSIIALQWVFVVVGLLGLGTAFVIRVQMCACKKHNEVTASLVGLQ
jgi:DHA1 family multidrug resistance protein-like MFS transporter